MNISSHCTIGKHAYGTCLNGYAHFSSLFLCAINVAIVGNSKSKLWEMHPVSMFCYIKTSFVGSKIAVMQAWWVLTQEKAEFLYTIQNIYCLTVYVILYLNAEVGGLSIRLKIKKKKKDQNKNNKRKQKTTTTTKKILLPSWDSNHDRLRGKQAS